MAGDYNEGPRNWCRDNYDSDPEYCDAILGPKETKPAPVVKKKCGGKIHGKKGYKSGGKVRGSGCCKRTKKCKMY